MARSITFVIDSDVDTQITITENLDGTLTFEIQVLGTGQIGDLRALFFDLDGLTADDGLSVYGSTDVTDSKFAEGGVDTLGKDANIKGSVSNELGDFDVGIEFGTSGIAGDDIQSTSFTLAHDSIDLTLDMIELADFGIRYTSVGEVDGDRTGSLKAGDQAAGIASNDSFSVEENALVGTNLLANDTNGTTNIVTAANDANGNFTSVGGGFERAVTINGQEIGTLFVGMDGQTSFDANGLDVDGLAEGETLIYSFTYQTTALDGSIATADATVTITGQNDAPSVVGIDAGIVSEDDAPTIINLLDGQSDAENDVLSAESILVTDEFGTAVDFVDNGNGTITIDPSQFGFLDSGESRTLTVNYEVSDGVDATANSAVLEISGADDAPDVLPDILVGRVGNHVNSIFYNQGGSFTEDASQLIQASFLDVALGDLDNDGDLDLFMSRGSSSNDIYLNDGAGNFTPNGQINLAVSHNMGNALGDLDGDGDLDAFVVRQSNTFEVVLLNDGNGQFTDSGQTLGQETGSATTSFDVALGDVDNDGDLDAWVANGLGVSDAFYFNDGSGNFTYSGQALDFNNSSDVEFGDLDGDGDLDAFVTNANFVAPEGNTVWINDGSGNFSDSGQMLGARRSEAVSLADFDGDGDLDAFVVNDAGQISGAENRLWLNDGAGNFTDSGQSLGTSNSQDVAIADMDGDGDLDAVVANLGSPDKIWLNDGNGVFADSGIDLGGTEFSYSIAVGDLDFM